MSDTLAISRAIGHLSSDIRLAGDAVQRAKKYMDAEDYRRAIAEVYAFKGISKGAERSADALSEALKC